MNYRFNLQPWRQLEREKKKKHFIVTTFLIAFIALSVAGLSYYVENKYIEDQESAKNFLQVQIGQLQSAKRKVEETQLLIDEINKQIFAIESLQSRRGTALRLLDYLATRTPDTVFLDHLQFNGEQMTIDGVAESDADVAEFMRVLQANDLFSKATLRGIESASSTSRYEVPPDSETKSFTVVADLKTFKGAEQ